MPGLFSSLSSRFSGGDGKLVSKIEEFSTGFLIQGAVSKALVLRREEVGLLGSFLAEELYRTYCSTITKRQPSDGALAGLAQTRKHYEGLVAYPADQLTRFEDGLKKAATALATLARQKGKYESGFTSVDGITEALVFDAISPYVAEIKGARKTAAH